MYQMYQNQVLIRICVTVPITAVAAAALNIGNSFKDEAETFLNETVNLMQRVDAAHALAEEKLNKDKANPETQELIKNLRQAKQDLEQTCSRVVMARDHIEANHEENDPVAEALGEVSDHLNKGRKLQSEGIELLDATDKKDPLTDLGGDVDELKQGMKEIEEKVCAATYEFVQTAERAKEEIELARQSIEEFFRSCAVIDEIKDEVFELLGLSPANLVVAVLAALIVLLGCVAFVFIGASAFLGDEAGPVIQSALVAAFGGVSAIWDNGKQQQTSDNAQESSASRLVEIITAKAKAVVGKLAQTKDDGLMKIFHSIGEAATEEASDVSSASGSGTGVGRGFGRGGARANFNKYAKNVERNNPEAYSAVKQQVMQPDATSSNTPTPQALPVAKVFSDRGHPPSDPRMAVVINSLDRLQAQVHDIHRSVYDERSEIGLATRVERVQRQLNGEEIEEDEVTARLRGLRRRKRAAPAPPPDEEPVFGSDVPPELSVFARGTCW